MEKERKPWRELADQLRMSFSPGYNGLADSPGLLRLGAWLPSVADDGEKLRRLIQDPRWRSMIDETIPGSISGEYRGLPVHVFPLVRRERGVLRSITRLVLLFPRQLGLGLRITGSSFIGGLVSRFSLGGSIRVPGAGSGFIVKGGDREPVLELLSGMETLEGLNRFFLAYPRGEIRDEGIIVGIEAGVPQPDRVQRVMDDLVDLALLFRQHP